MNCSEAITGPTTYVFTGNGDHTFNFVDHLGNPGSVIATVDWIYKGELTVGIAYVPSNLHSGSITVIATLNSTGGAAPTNWTASGTHQYYQVFNGVADEDNTYTGTVVFENHVGTT